MNMQTVEQLKSVRPPSESLWHFLAGLPATMEAQILMALMLAGILGSVAHYLTRWAKNEIKGDLLSYLFIDNPRRSLLSAILLFSELVGEIGTGIFTSADGVFVGWGLVLLSGLKSGYAIDSIANKAERPAWTDEQRQSNAEASQPTTNGDTR